MSTLPPPSASPDDQSKHGIPRLSLLGVFLRFLQFGATAWGGPVAQIGMIRQELVDQATSPRF